MTGFAEEIVGLDFGRQRLAIDEKSRHGIFRLPDDSPFNFSPTCMRLGMKSST